MLRAIGGAVSFYLLGLLLFALAFLPFAPRLIADQTVDQLSRNPSVRFALVQGALLLAAFAAATWVVGKKAFRLSAYDLRWRPRLGWARGLGAGLALGVVPAALAMTLGVFAGGAAWRPDGGSFPAYAGQVTKTVLLLAPAALSEELMFRGLPMVLLAGAFGRPASMLILSVLFGLAHVTNPDVTVRAIGNITLAGLLLSVAFYSPGGMWAAFGAHIGWNGTLAALGAPVSGLPFDIPMIDYSMGGPPWLTGGTFGPEGGLLATMVIAGAVVLAGRWIRRDPT
jgi:membrane protease YdiL (CAAX protease family)